VLKQTVYGLPLNPMPLLETLRGASFCVSFGTREKLGKQIDQAIELVGDDQILLVDNGAFSAHKAGDDTRGDDYVEAYAAWANDILARCPQAWAVYPDIIGGNEQDNLQLIHDTMMLFDDPDRVMPVWHMHESIGYLLHLCESFGYIAIGSSGDFWKVGTPKWHARIREAFAAIEQWMVDGDGAFERPRIHMMRAQSQAHLYGFDSSDSTNVAVNHGRQRKLGEPLDRFAARVDRRIQASAGAEAAHQVKRPLLDHVEAAQWRLEQMLTAAGYQVAFIDPCAGQAAELAQAA
jgi:hypothetical protein